MSLGHGASVVRDGLVLHLDAANMKSYPGSGTTWYDLSGNGNEGTLINGPIYDTGSISFSATNDYATLGGSTPLSLRGNPSFSVEGWFKKAASWNNGASWGIGGDSGGQGINSWNSSYTDHISIDLWGISTYSSGVLYSSTDWQHIVWTYNGGGFTRANVAFHINTVTYTNTALTVIRGGSGTPNINANGLVIGRAGRNTNLYYGIPIISRFSIYDRVLTTTEIKQNFEALRGRYGI